MVILWCLLSESGVNWCYCDVDVDGDVVGVNVPVDCSVQLIVD